MANFFLLICFVSFAREKSRRKKKLNQQRRIYKHNCAAVLDDERQIKRPIICRSLCERVVVIGILFISFYFVWYLFTSIFSEAKQSENQQINHVISAAAAFFLLCLSHSFADFVLLILLAAFVFFFSSNLCSFQANCLLMLKLLLALHLLAIIRNVLFKFDIWFVAGMHVCSL